MTRWRTLHRRRRQAGDPRVMLRKHFGRLARASFATAKATKNLGEAFKKLAESAFFKAAGDVMADGESK